MKRWWRMFQEFISPVRKRKCEWCQETSRFKKVRIWDDINPAGNVKAICPKCVKNPCCGD
jgi:hypothetical protein